MLEILIAIPLAAVAIGVIIKVIEFIYFVLMYMFSPSFRRDLEDK